MAAQNHTTRRQFVTLAAAATPFVLLGAPALAQPGAGRDPVLDQIVADLRELQREWDEKPNDRRGQLRAIEATFGVLAAHLGHSYDAQLQRDLRRQIARQGRAVTINDLAQRLNKPHAEVDTALRIYDQRGPAAAIRDAQRAVRQLRLNSPGVAHVTLRQSSWCQDVASAIGFVEWSTNFTCAMAWAGPAAAEACLAMTVALATLQATYYFGC